MKNTNQEPEAMLQVHFVHNIFDLININSITWSKNISVTEPFTINGWIIYLDQIKSSHAQQKLDYETFLLYIF